MILTYLSERENLNMNVCVCVCACVNVGVCVFEREREADRERFTERHIAIVINGGRRRVWVFVRETDRQRDT